jgi:hypothetical protein
MSRVLGLQDRADVVVCERFWAIMMDSLRGARAAPLEVVARPIREPPVSRYYLLIALS